jgi:ABC-type Fe3+ transport system permease subunit
MATDAGVIALAQAQKENKSTEEQVNAVAAAIGKQPSRKVADVLWVLFVVVLSVALLLTLGLAGWSVMDGNADTSPEIFLGIFTAVLTGLVGIFVKSPVQ